MKSSLSNQQCKCKDFFPQYFYILLMCGALLCTAEMGAFIDDTKKLFYPIPSKIVKNVMPYFWLHS